MRYLQGALECTLVQPLRAIYAPGVSMFGWFRNKPSHQSVVVLAGIERASAFVSPERFVTPEDAAFFVQPYLVTLSRMLGRSEAQRFLPVSLGHFTSKIYEYSKTGQLDRLMTAATGDEVLLGAMAAAYWVGKAEAVKEAPTARNQLVEVKAKLNEFVGHLNRLATK